MTVTILQGDVREMLKTLPAESVQCVVTSPPYFQLRSYLPDGHPDKVSEIGLEQTPAEFVAALVDVFREVRRVLKPDGVVFVNIGDSYSGSGKGPQGNGLKESYWTKPETAKLAGAKTYENIPAKNLLLIPQRFAIAMQDDGWIVRSQIAWCKKSAMPESVRDRPTSAWEPIWMFTKNARYFWDADAVRQPQTGGTHSRGKGAQGAPKIIAPGQGIKNNSSFQAAMVHDAPLDGLANLRNWWPLGPEPLREAHYAAFPSEIPRRCILAATSEKGQCTACGSPWVRVVERERNGDSWINPKGAATQYGGKGTERLGPGIQDKRGTVGWQPSCRCDAGDPVPQIVLDPFLGSGTTALVADQLGRNAVGCELNPEYAEMARRRIAGSAPMFADVAVVDAPQQLLMEPTS